MSRDRTNLLNVCVITFILTVLPVQTQAQLSNSPVKQLPLSERIALKDEQPTITGKNGNYLAKILVKASPDVVWAVLTDYTNFPKFLPHLVSTKILAVNGNRQVVEQIDSRQFFLINQRSRVSTENILTAKKRIDFHLVDGDLKQIEGYWLLEPISSYPGATPTQVLITQQISAQPKAGIPKGIFNNIFKKSLQENLTAISKEVTRRTQ